MALIDLHTHSTASDGTLSPTELVHLAQTKGLQGLALTDHDTVGGLDEAMAAAEQHGITFIPGVEISAQIDQGALHILGLYIDHRNTELNNILDWLVQAREERNQQLLEKLGDLGFTITAEEIKEVAGDFVTGRPHFAMVLAQKGYVKNQQSAFKKYLGSKGQAYVKRRKPPIDWAIRAIRQAGGLPILAHPDQTKLKGKLLENFLAELRRLGLEGIEVHYSGYTQSQIWKYARLAKRFDLVESGGSDFHGSIKPGIQLGRGPGGLHVSDSLLGPLEERARLVRENADASD